MTAAELLARAERRAKTLHVSKIVLELAFYLALGVGLYVAGARHGRASQTLAQLQAHRDTVMDTVRVVEQRLVHDTVHVRVAAARADTARTRADSADRAVLTVADTSRVVPTSLVLPAIQLCQQATADDDSLITALHVEVADLTKHDQAETARAEADEQELKASSHRFGFRAGLLSGLAVAAALVHFLH